MQVIKRLIIGFAGTALLASCGAGGEDQERSTLLTCITLWRTNRIARLQIKRLAAG